jgi:DNA invertase Pin-like site-specific DNA recombinase
MLGLWRIKLESFWPGGGDKKLENILRQQQRFRAGIYARVSTYDQQTLPMQINALKEYAHHRNMEIVIQEKDVGSGIADRPKREKLLQAARKREIDVILVWRLDRWGRSLADLVLSLQELTSIGVGFISLNEALDMTTPGGRALAGMLAVFAEFEHDVLRERIRAGIAQAKKEGRPHGRPNISACHTEEVKNLAQNGMSQNSIAKRTGIARTTVRRLLNS